MDRTTTVDNRSVSPDPHDKVESDHIEVRVQKVTPGRLLCIQKLNDYTQLGHLQDKGFVGGHVVTQLPTTSSVQDADIEPVSNLICETFKSGRF